MLRVHRLSERGDTVAVVGRLRAVDDDSITLRVGARDTASVLTLARATITGVEVQRGAKEQDQWVAALATAGAITGGIVAIKWCSDNPAACAREQREADRAEHCGDSTGVLTTTSMLIGAGAVAAGLIGYAIGPRRRWEPIALPVILGPGGGGAPRWGMLLGVRLPLASTDRGRRGRASWSRMRR